MIVRKCKTITPQNSDLGIGKKKRTTDTNKNITLLVQW